MISDSILAIIPARAGSKGIPKKNHITLNGFPLIHWTITSAIQSKFINKIVISSDDNAILKMAKKNNIITRNRPQEISKDDTLMEEVLVDVINSFKDIDQYKYLLLLQPTSPLRTSEHIDDAIKLIRSEEAQALISVTTPLEIPQKMMTVNEEGYLSGLIDNEKPFMSRQLIEETYKPNGAIYIVNTEAFKTKNSFLQKKNC